MMKAVTFALLAFIVSLVFADPLALDPRIIERVNSDPKATWQAGHNEVFANKKVSEIQHMLGAFLVNPATDRSPKLFATMNANDIPKEFDSYTNWPKCSRPVRNQARCGSCWAFSAAEALGDRYCIATGDGSFPILSPQDMVSCDKTDYGCNGGYLTNAWRYLENTGIVTDQCMSYKSGGGFVPSCPSQCDNPSTPFKKYKAKTGSTQHFGSVEAAQQSIMTAGPIQAGFMVYQDFFSYKSGVYHHVSGGLAGGHAVLITGWGVAQDGTAYWRVKNSWSESWGMQGYFLIARGKNECQIESQLYAGQADN